MQFASLEKHQFSKCTFDDVFFLCIFSTLYREVLLVRVDSDFVTSSKN